VGAGATSARAEEAMPREGEAGVDEDTAAEEVRPAMNWPSQPRASPV